MNAPAIPKLTAEEFPTYFSDLWNLPAGEGPFPWQTELAAQLARDRKWPSLVDLPTGTGKTSLLDIAVFQMALEAHRAPEERWMARRVVLVVDRRVVVDQADERGHSIAARLMAADPDGVLGRVATRLRHLCAAGPEDPPLVTSVLRGGIVRDERWAQRPDVPTVISSTVDQVGSRLLFRGYGVSAGMRPIHAALLAHDCLFLLDEVHLARPFARTLAAVGEYRSRAPEPVAAGPDRWQVVEMTATPSDGVTGSRFPSAPLDPGSHPVLRRRLTASKPARLASVVLPTHAAKADRLFAEACAEEAQELLDGPHVTALGVIVNRVTTARQIAGLLTDRLDADVLLLTGRMRPIDRDATLRLYGDRLATGRPRDAATTPLVLVATQCVEAGADFDLDAVVTECASLDALRQRFGRVDRDGRRAEAGGVLTSVVLARGPQMVEGVEDPVYGSAMARTWAWLTDGGRDTVDFGLRALAVPDAETLAVLVPPLRAAPVMLPSHLDAWARTQPAPALEPDVSRWLHGIQEGDPEVQLLWREDIQEHWLTEAGQNESPRPPREDCDRVAAAHVESCPPVASEALSLPLSAARRWLRGEPEGEAFDVEGVSGDGGDASPDRRPWRAVRWSADGNAAVVGHHDLRPGDVLVVPSSFGGLTLDSWDPAGREAVVDVAAEATRERRRLVVLRLDPELRRGLGAFPEIEAWTQSTSRERRRLLDGWLGEQGDRAGPALRRDTRDALAAPARARQDRLVDGFALDGSDPVPGTLVVTAPARMSTDVVAGRASAAVPLDVEGSLDALSFGGAGEVTLAAHLEWVTRWVGGLAARTAVRPDLAADLDLAAARHDLGKADPRFQTWLHGGDEIARAGAPAPLAKAREAAYDRAARERALQLSGYPRGARHELLSVAMSAAEPELKAQAHDYELVLHLIAAHHGRCRPFASVVADPASVRVTYEQQDGRRWEADSAHGLERLDAGIPERYATLTERYGWYGLAWLETLLRLADHGRSAQEQMAAETTQ